LYPSILEQIASAGKMTTKTLVDADYWSSRWWPDILQPVKTQQGRPLSAMIYFECPDCATTDATPQSGVSVAWHIGASSTLVILTLHRRCC